MLQYITMETKMFGFLAYAQLWLKTIREANHASRVYFELSQLSNKDLKELGISRSEIPIVAFNAAQKLDQ